MTDEKEPGTDEQADSKSTGPVGGERLAEARRKQQISIFEIAKELHLDEPKVRALEHNDFDMLGAPVFAKGHLRKYAQLVGVNVDDLFADYYQMTRSAGMPPVVTGRRKAARELSPGPWIAVIIVVLVAIAAYWLLTNRPVSGDIASPKSEVPERSEIDAIPLSEVDVPVEDDTLVLSSTATETTPVPNTVTAAVDETSVDDAETEVQAAAPSEVSAQADASRVRLSLSFSGDCWTEISDADGRRLFFGMGQDGRNVELIGTAPISALFGDAGNVTVWVDGQDYTIPAESRRGRTARVQIGNP